MKLISIFILGIMLISLASGMTFDNVKQFDGLNKVTIKDNFGLGGELVSVELLENTDNCLTECYAIWNVTIYDGEDNFLDLIEFYDISDKKRSIKNKFEYVSKYEKNTIPIYNRICSGKEAVNQSCPIVLTDTITEDVRIWSDFDPRRKLPDGNYIIKLTGYKNFDDNIDWKPTFYGEKIDEWAWWNGIQPEGYWKLNETGEENATDSSGMDRQGNRTGATTWEPTGKINGSLDIDLGTGNRLTFGDYDDWDFSADEDKSVGFWFNVTGAGAGVNYLLSKATGHVSNGAWTIYLGSANKEPIFYLDDSGVEGNCIMPYGGTSYNDGLWHHIVITRDGDSPTNSIKMYIDGSLANQTDCPVGSVADESTDMKLGGDGISSGGGLFDEVFLYNITLSATDISIIYNGGDGLQLDDLSLRYAIINSVVYNDTAYDTANERYVINVTYNNSGTFSNISGVFSYNNVEYASSKIFDDGSDALFDVDLIVPINLSGSIPFFWNFTLVNDTDTYYDFHLPYNQEVTYYNLTFCDGPQPFINYTFKDETSLAEINSTINLITDYYLGNQSLNKTFTFQNTTENLNYEFCFVPVEESMTIAGYNYYSGAAYPQRRNDFNSILTNSTTTKTLYLLSEDDGVYIQMQVINSITGNAVSGVNLDVSRTISGNTEVVQTDLSDDAGVVILFLNPDFMYSFTFTKEGYQSLTQSLQPTSADVYSVYLVPTTGDLGEDEGWNAPEITDSLSYEILPTPKFLSNDTTYLFTFSADSSNSLTITMNITNDTGYQIYYADDTGTSASISNNINTGANTFLKGYYTLDDGTETLTFERHWDVRSYEEGDYSLWAWLTFWDDQDDGGTGTLIISWIKILLVAGCLFSVFSLMYTKVGGSDKFDSALPAIISGAIVLWIFSLAGWLYIDVFPYAWLDKNGIATLITLIGLVFIGWSYSQS